MPPTTRWAAEVEQIVLVERQETDARVGIRQGAKGSEPIGMLGR